VAGPRLISSWTPTAGLLKSVAAPGEPLDANNKELLLRQPCVGDMHVRVCCKPTSCPGLQDG
jgi:hypothetical protein